MEKGRWIWSLDSPNCSNIIANIKLPTEFHPKKSQSDDFVARGSQWAQWYVSSVQFAPTKIPGDPLQVAANVSPLQPHGDQW